MGLLERVFGNPAEREKRRLEKISGRRTRPLPPTDANGKRLVPYIPRPDLIPRPDDSVPGLF